MTGLTPIAALKAVKNSVEIEGMRQCHIRDGAAVCEYLAWLQNKVKRGERVTEISGMKGRILSFICCKRGGIVHPLHSP